MLRLILLLKKKSCLLLFPSVFLCYKVTNVSQKLNRKSKSRLSLKKQSLYLSLIRRGEAMLAKTIFTRTILVSRCFASAASKTLKVGDVLREARVYSSEDVKSYAEVSHDWNPLHFDQELARKSGFENRLVHGMLVSSMFPRIISSHFPGAVYVSQSLHFRSPVHIGDEILGLVQATALRETKNKYIVKFSTRCIKNNTELVVLDGEATAILPSLHML